MALTVTRRDLDELHLDPSNPRLHGQKNLDAIVGSLKTFGQVDPLVVQAGTGRIIGGNGRYEAMRALGWKHADVVELDVDDHRATALGIALNRTSELAEWDAPGLEALLGQISADGFDVGSIGFDADDLAALDHDGVTSPKDGAKEISENEFQDFVHLCPRCGFSFNKPALQVVPQEAT